MSKNHPRRSRVIALATSIALVAAGAWGGLASAQLSDEGGPIQVDADNGEILDREKKAVYWGNVDVIQGDARLRAEKIEVFYSGTESAGGIGGGFGELRTIVASGDVFYVTPDFKARGDVGTYDAVAGTITLEGDVVVSRCNDVATGERLVLLLGEGRSLLTAGEDERVRMVIGPEGPQVTGQAADGCES